MAEGSSVGDVRLILWRLEAPSTAAEFDVGGWRPDKMISRVTEGEGGSCHVEREWSCEGGSGWQRGHQSGTFD